MKDRPKGFLSEDKIDHNGDIFHYIQNLHEYLWRFVRVAIPGASGDLGDLVDRAVELMEAATGPVLIITIRNGILQHVIANQRNVRFIPITNGVPAPIETAEYDPAYVQQGISDRTLIVTYPAKHVSTWILHGRSTLDAITGYAWALAVIDGHVGQNCHIEVELEGDHFAAYLVRN